MKTQLPTLDPLAVMFLNSYLRKITAAPFVSREFNISLPELIAETLRIVSEVEHE